MKIAFSIIGFLTGLSILYGQPVIAPLGNNPAQIYHSKSNKAFKITAVSDTIDLPFFEDFTTSNITPDTSKWVDNGGTFISNSYAVNPPNFNVATFDGLKADGNPYNINNNGTIIGLADNLTSLPIDLSVLPNGKTLHLRFYWQGETLGEPADTNVDSIRLQIKNRSGGWKTIWKQSDDSSGFNLQQLTITDSSLYFYKGFQFKFENFGRLSGSFDTWNIDYILLDTGMLAGDNWTPDISFVGPPTSILKDYTAMPLSQFRQTELADTIRVVIKTLDNKERGFNIKDTLFFNNQIKDQGTDIEFLPPGNTFEQAVKIDSTLFKNFTGETILKYKFALERTGGDPRVDSTYDYYTSLDNLGLSDIDFQVNDSITRINPLTDYFAYDDGSAEYGFGINQKRAKMAVKFSLNEPDTLTHIDILFPKIIDDWTNQSFILMVWSNLQPGTSNETLLYQESAVISHPSNIDVFKTYTLSSPVYISSPTFYVGYRHLVKNQYVYVGLDVNNDKSQTIFYTINDIWKAYDNDPGALMIRPVFRSQTLTGTTKKTEELAANVYPNPSNGKTFITGDVAEAYVYDLSGRLLLSQSFDIQNYNIKTLDISSLENGFYLVHLINGDQKAVRKIFLNK